MIKRIAHTIRLLIPAGKANPSPPIGPALGQKGINISKFCKDFNDRTSNLASGTVLSVKIEVLEDKSFQITTKGLATADLIKRKIQMDSDERAITAEDLVEIAKEKLVDLNTRDLNKAVSIIKGSVKSMHIKVITNN